MGYCYILANKKNGTIYVGVSGNLQRRIYEHKQGVYEGFTKKYNCNILVWYQAFLDIQEAIQCEKKIKGWTREKKVDLIEQQNLSRKDMSGDLQD